MEHLVSSFAIPRPIIGLDLFIKMGLVTPSFTSLSSKNVTLASSFIYHLFNISVHPIVFKV